MRVILKVIETNPNIYLTIKLQKIKSTNLLLRRSSEDGNILIQSFNLPPEKNILFQSSSKSLYPHPLALFVRTSAKMCKLSKIDI